MYFTKDAEGNLILVKAPVVGEMYFNSDGEEVKCEEKKPDPPAAPAVHIPDDPITELTNTVREMASGFTGAIGSLKEKEEILDAKIGAYDDAMKRGFPVPTGLDKGLTSDDKAEIWAPYDLAVQGKELMSKFGRAPNAYRIEKEETREEMAKWMILFIKATLAQDQVALQELRHNPKYTPAGWETKTALSSSSFPVPDIVMAEILGFAREKSIALQDARVWPMTSEKMSFPAESTAPSVSWGATTSESTPTVSEIELTALELSAYAALRNPLLADTRSDIVSWLTELMAEAQGKELDNCMFNGDGAAASASCSGVLSAAAGYSVVFASGSTNFSEIGASHLSELISKLDGLKKVGAKFYMNGAVFHYVRNLTDDQSRPIFIETVGAPMSGTIWGYPYREAIMCPGTSAADTGFVLYGNLKYFAVGRRLDVTTLEANPWVNDAWVGNQTWFKLYNRWALDIALANGFARLVTAAS